MHDVDDYKNFTAAFHEYEPPEQAEHAPSISEVPEYTEMVDDDHWGEYILLLTF